MRVLPFLSLALATACVQRPARVRVGAQEPVSAPGPVLDAGAVTVAEGAPALAGAPPAITPEGPPALEAEPVAAAPDHPPIARVVIVSEDGLRPDALARAQAPTHARLIAEGAFTPRARTIQQASTLPAHAAMLSGFDVAEHGLSWNSWVPSRGFIHVPTVFSAAVDAGDLAAAFVGKQKLAHIIRPDTIALFSRPGYLCPKVAEEAAAYLVAQKPRLEFVHFSDPDARGHASGWMSDEQIAGVEASDHCLGVLVDAIVAGGLASDTLVIVSADHGGHGKNHSGYGHEEDRLIPWLAWGAGVRHGHAITGPVNTFDTAATARWALGYPSPPGTLGHPVAEAFGE